jgi:hypothetical protein
MRIEPETVHSVRAVTTWALRLLGVLIVAWGLYLALQRVIFGFNTGELSSAWIIYDGIGDSHRVSRGIAAACIGGVIAATADIISAWAIVAPRRGCPRCGYAGGEGGVCPECGLTGLRRD